MPARSVERVITKHPRKAFRKKKMASHDEAAPPATLVRPRDAPADAPPAAAPHAVAAPPGAATPAAAGADTAMAELVGQLTRLVGQLRAPTSCVGAWRQLGSHWR